jgi:hypothetical protein
MVRTTVRNIYLSILQSTIFMSLGGNPVYYKYMISYPYCNYLMHYSCFVRDFWLHIDRNYILKDEYMLKSSLEDNLDEMMYLHDLLNSNKPQLKKVDIRSLDDDKLLPNLLRHPMYRWIVHTGQQRYKLLN